MSIASKLLRGGMQLSAGHAAQQAFAFLRNILVARLIGPDDFGVAVTFILVMSALSVISDLGVEQYIIRSTDGEKEQLQSTLHFILIIRGIFIGLILYFTAYDIANLFKVPESVWVYQLLAIIPIIKGFLHLDIRRFQRNFEYYPAVISTLGSVILGTTVAIVLAFELRSYEAMLFAFLVEAIAMVGLSHCKSIRTYQVRMHRAYVLSILTYGWPLTINGIVIFLMNQGDRLVIGVNFGTNELANYAVASILTYGSAILIQQVSGAIYVPLLSSSISDEMKYQRYIEFSGALTAAFGLIITIFMVLYGPQLIELLYGVSYDVPSALVLWLAFAAGFRILRSWPIAISIANGDTREVLYPNLIRSVAFLVAIYLVMHGFGPVEVGAAMAGGELLAAGFALQRADLRASKQNHLGRKTIVLYLLIFLVTGICQSQNSIASMPGLMLLTLFMTVGLSLLGVNLIFPSAYRDIKVIFRQLHNRKTNRQKD